MQDERNNAADSAGRDERLEEATAARLAKLRTTPVDTSRLEASLRRVRHGFSRSLKGAENLPELRRQSGYRLHIVH